MLGAPTRPAPDESSTMPPATPCHHRPGEVVAHLHRHDAVALHHREGVVDRLGQERPVVRIGAGAVHDQPDLEILRRRRDRRHRVGLGEVDGDGARLDVRLGPDRSRDVVEDVLAAGEQHDVDPRPRDRSGEGRADALGGADDECPRAVAVGEAHGASSNRGRTSCSNSRRLDHARSIGMPPHSGWKKRERERRRLQLLHELVGGQHGVLAARPAARRRPRPCGRARRRRPGPATRRRRWSRGGRTGAICSQPFSVSSARATVRFVADGARARVGVTELLALVAVEVPHLRHRRDEPVGDAGRPPRRRLAAAAEGDARAAGPVRRRRDLHRAPPVLERLAGERRLQRRDRLGDPPTPARPSGTSNMANSSCT